jgi:hypothetical protein
MIRPDAAQNSTAGAILLQMFPIGNRPAISTSRPLIFRPVADVPHLQASILTILETAGSLREDSLAEPMRVPVEIVRARKPSQ